MEHDNDVTKVVFRKFKEGDVIALFPEVATDRQGINCLSYQHIGQHGAASTLIVNSTTLATESEYADLKRELENRIGYNLKVCKRITRQMDEARRADARW